MLRHFKIAFGLLFFVNLASEPRGFAGITFEPYYSVSSTKSINPSAKKKGTETEKITQREEKGLTAGLKIFSLFEISASVGQNFAVTTAKDSVVKDEYQEIDFNKEVDTSTKVDGFQSKSKETQNRARFKIAIDPGFWIFIARVEAGVIANQRIVELYEDDQLKSKLTPPISYKPTAGGSLGVRLSPRMFALAHYSFYFFKFPEEKPFEREMGVSIGFSI